MVKRGNEYITYSLNSRTHDNYYGHRVGCAPYFRTQAHQKVISPIMLTLICSMIETTERLPKRLCVKAGGVEVFQVSSP
jgi:hypothetical protein